MSDFDDKLNKILSSPEEMEKLMSIARSFSESSESEGGDKNEDTASENSVGGIDPKMLSMMSRIMGQYSSAGSDKASLLNSMKPYLKAERRGSIDRALEITKLAKLAKLALGELSEGGKDV